MCYVNTDIVLLQDFADALAQVARRFGQFLMIGQRTDLSFSVRLKVGKRGWRQSLGTLARTRGTLHNVGGIDYFAFRRGLYPKVPPFAVGRYAWDNWLVRDVVRRGKVPVIDASARILAIHQEHKRWPKTDTDCQRNRELYATESYHRGKGGNRICDATWILDGRGLRRR